MTTKDMIRAQVESVAEKDLDELYRLIKRFVESKQGSQLGGIMSKLRDVKIDAPTDFAANLDLYTSGEKRVGDDLH